MDKKNLYDKLLKYSEWIEYNNILNIDINKLIKTIDINELLNFNDILIKNKVKTCSVNDINKWLEYWVRIFKMKSRKYIINSIRIIDEVLKDYKKYEGYSTLHNDGKIMDYTDYIKSQID
jgi:hypothetical protein